MSATENHDSDEIRIIYHIPEDNYPKFEKEVAKLSRRSEKLIGMPIKPVVFGYDYKKDEKTGKPLYKYFEVLFTAQTPKIDGWKFVATLDHAQETGNIVRAVPGTGISIPERYRTIGPKCDHCNVNRRRNDTYLVCEETTGDFKQVGHSCLIDFFGHDPYRVARMAEFLSYIDEIARGYSEPTGRARHYIPLEDFLEHVAWAIRTHGWVSGSAAYNDPTGETIATKTTAYDNMFPGQHRQSEPLADEDKELAAKALEFVRGKTESDEDLNDFWHNLTVAARAQMIDWRTTGYAAAIVSTYLRETGYFKPKAKTDIGDMKGILELFSRTEGKLKKPSIILLTKDGDKDVEVRLYKAGSFSKYQGDIQVVGTNSQGEYYGRISADSGIYNPSRQTQPTGLVDTLMAFAADPATVASEFGRKTGLCSFCYRPLKDARSTEVGYGKICASRYGLAWGTTVKTKKSKIECSAEPA